MSRPLLSTTGKWLMLLSTNILATLEIASPGLAVIVGFFLRSRTKMEGLRIRRGLTVQPLDGMRSTELLSRKSPFSIQPLSSSATSRDFLYDDKGEV
jgi:hypothetical protein